VSGELWGDDACKPYFPPIKPREPHKRREYKSGTGWCVWRWTFVPSDYIVRLHLIKTPWFAICLHWLVKPDPEPYLHDHPVSFLSLILRGGYNEYRQQVFAPIWDMFDMRSCPWYNFIRATDRHTIMYVLPHTLTLCFMGPKTREWGFHTPTGWVYWKDYYAQQAVDKS
jgi:hypothetical protein